MRNENKLEGFWKASSGINRNTRTNDFIRENIKALVEKCNTADPFTIAEYMDIEVRWEAFGEHPLGQTVYFENKPSILLNQNIKYTVQQYFTCGHEIGHIILQPETTGYQTGRLSHDVCEYQANQFATGLMGLLYVEENGYGPESYYDLVHHYGSPVKELD